MVTVRFRLRAQSWRIWCQVGLTSSLKRVMISPAAMPSRAAGSILRNVVDDRRAVEVLVDLMVIMPTKKSRNEGQDEVGERGRRAR